MGVFWISSQPSFPGARLSARCFTFWGLILSKDPVLVAHGGAWGIPDDMVEAHLNGVRNAIAAGWHALSHGGFPGAAGEGSRGIMGDEHGFRVGRGRLLH